MKNKTCLTILLIVSSILLKAQGYVTIISDQKHLGIVSQNGAIRSVSENTNQTYLQSINSRLDDINLNMGTVLLLQNTIYRSLTHVDKALKSTITLERIAEVSNEIFSECKEMIRTAKKDPKLLLFAEDMAFQVKQRSVKLAGEVTGFILHEGENILMDYGKRDALLSKIILELCVIRGQVFSINRSMHYAKLNGFLNAVNPFKGFINRDKYLAMDIVRNIRILKH